jgi:aminopeptidase N
MGRYSITNNHFAARTDFDLALRVPKKFVAVAVGTKAEEREEDQYRMTRWQSDIPLAVAGFAYGDYKLVTEKVGEMQVEVYANRQADDFIRTASALTVGGEAHLALQSINPARMAPEIAREVANSVRVMERYYGPYPYKKLAVTNIPYSYGQGWPGLLYVSILSFLDSFQRNVFGIRDSVQLTDFFRAHETSHQWWGHAVGWKSYHDQWLSEGFAQFSGILYAMHRRKQGEYLRLLRDDRDQLLEEDREGAVYDQIGPIYAGLRLSSSKHLRGYPVLVYGKGGWVLHMIRMMLYDPRNPQDPDAAFIALMQDFTRTFHNRPASTEDFKAMVEKHMTPWMNVDGNGKMDWFFDSWVYGTGVPRIELNYRVEPGASPNQYVLRGSIGLSGVPENFRTIVPLFLHQGKGVMRVGWLRVRGPDTPFSIPLGFKPDKLTMNEGEDILCTMK